MKNFKSYLFLPLLLGILLFSSFSKVNSNLTRLPNPLKNYAWYTPSGQFVAWSTITNAEYVTGNNASTDPTNGTLVIIGYGGGNFGQPPAGAPLVYLYTHP